MARILILGAGVMGSALTVPSSDNGNHITLVGTHLDDGIIQSVKSSHYHPNLDETLPDKIEPLYINELRADHVKRSDAVILGVSSEGIDWAVELLVSLNAPIQLLALVTKGLEPSSDGTPLTYVTTIPKKLDAAGIPLGGFVGIGGPCIAREIVVRQPTVVVYASKDDTLVDNFISCMQTPHYRVSRSSEVIGVEACAALKNFLAIGVSAMITRYKMDAVNNVAAKNPVAATFNQAVLEMTTLCTWMGGDYRVAFDLAGMGDLQVTVGGGRNSRLGMCLGNRLVLQEALDGPMLGETVEGKATGEVLGPAIRVAIDNGDLHAARIPLTLAILACIENGGQFEFDFKLMGTT